MIPLPGSDKRAPQANHTQRISCVLAGDLLEGLERFKEESGLPWAEVRLLATSTLNLWRWRHTEASPTLTSPWPFQNQGDSMSLGHLLPDARVRELR